MRLRLNFSLVDTYMTLDYHKVFLKFIKKSISEYQQGKFFDDFYNKDISKNGCKDYSWSVGFNKPIFKDKYIEVTGKEANMIFVSPSEKNIFIFFNAFMNQKSKEMKISENNWLKLENVKVIEDKDIKGNLMEAKILSAIILRDHDKERNKDTYFSVEDGNFIHELKKKLKRDYSQYEKEIDNLMVDTSRAKKVVITLYGQQINATIGTLLFVGDENLLRHLYRNSIGSRKALGFGVIDKVLDGDLKI